MFYSIFILFTTGFIFTNQPTTPVNPHPKGEDSDPTILIQTDLGPVFAKLYADEAPLTVKHFLGLVDGSMTYRDPHTGEEKAEPFYRDQFVHKIYPGKEIRLGCSLGSGKSTVGVYVKHEINAKSSGVSILKPESLEELHRFFQFHLVPVFNRHLPTKNWPSEEFRKVMVTYMQTFEVKPFFGKAWPYYYELEGYIYQSRETHKAERGSLVMVCDNKPNKNSNRFAILLSEPDPQFVGRRTVFGQVIQGMDIVDQIAKIPVDRKMLVEERIGIRSITLVDTKSLKTKDHRED